MRSNKLQKKLSSGKKADENQTTAGSCEIPSQVFLSRQDEDRFQLRFSQAVPIRLAGCMLIFLLFCFNCTWRKLQRVAIGTDQCVDVRHTTQRLLGSARVVGLRAVVMTDPLK